MGLAFEKVAFFTKLEYLGKEIRNHRDSIINREFLFTSNSSINELLNVIKSFKDKINTLKKNIVLTDLREDVDKYFVSEVNYLDSITNSMRVVLKNINNNVHSDNYVMENNLLYQTALMSKLSSEIDNLEKSSIYYSFFEPKGEGVSTIDGRSIKLEDKGRYQDLSKYLDCAKRKHSVLEKEIENLGVDKKDDMFIVANSESLIEKYKRRIEEILNAPGMKMTVKISGEKYYVPKRFAKEFKLLMMRVNKYSSNFDNTMPSVISSPFLSLGHKGTKIIKDNNKYLGKITGFYGKFDEVDFSRDDKLNCIGKIKVDNSEIEREVDDKESNEEVVYYDVRSKNNKHHNYSKRVRIFGKRQASNVQKIKRGIITSSVALALSLVTAVTAFGVSKISFWKDNSVDSITDSYADVIEENVDSNKINISHYEKNDFDNNKVNSTDALLGVDDSIINSNMMFKASDDDKVSLNDNKMVNVNLNKEVDNNVEKDKSEDNSIDIISINDEITVTDGAHIYTNCIDACKKSDGLDPYYDSDYKRTIRGVAFESDGSIVYTYSQQDYDYWVEKGANIEAVCCDDGFYNIDDVKILSYNR